MSRTIDWSYDQNCHCDMCSRHRLYLLIRETKKNWPVPEYDWPYLKMMDKRSREDPLWYTRRPPSA